MGPELMYFRQREAELRARAELHRLLREAREVAEPSGGHERKGGGRRLLSRRSRSAASTSAC